MLLNRGADLDHCFHYSHLYFDITLRLCQYKSCAPHICEYLCLLLEPYFSPLRKYYADKQSKQVVQPIWFLLRNGICFFLSGEFLKKLNNLSLLSQLFSLSNESPAFRIVRSAGTLKHNCWHSVTAAASSTPPKRFSTTSTSKRLVLRLPLPGRDRA